MRKVAFTCLLFCLVPSIAFGHHGVASLGVAGLEGPGAPIETSSSATLPEGTFFFYTKLDYAQFEKFTAIRDEEGDFSAFWIYGVGYGLKPYLSLYLFAPFNTKKVEDNSFNTSGFADVSVMGVIGLKYDEGFRVVPRNESLDDLWDWHFTIYGGLTLPTGNANIRDSSGKIDPGMSLGFGRPSYTIGSTATRQLTDRITWVADVSLITFSDYRYEDNNSSRFGDEYRFNTALSVRLLADADSKLRVDGNIEVNCLKLDRDETNGIAERATGGNIIYLVPGIRLYYKSVSVGLGVKLPGWADLNEESEQQGAEGREDYRSIFVVSLIL